ncbi:MAG: hypothetical protein EOO90_00410 [Pedobacter sp.]|nr:MAG: hypothetical protein EOO90_00410 [Pedobacter sp.]
MKRFFFAATIVIASLSACKKEESITPTAEFSVSGVTGNSMTMGTFDQYTVSNLSTDAASYLWDLGNGTTFNTKDIVLTYPKSGDYVLSLTSTSKDGKTSVSTKNVKVVNPILNQVVVKSITQNLFDRLGSSKAKVWVEIVKAEHDRDYPVLSNGSFDAPVIYKSPVATDVIVGAAPIVFHLPQEIVIDIPTLAIAHGYKGRGYGFNLYGEGDNGVAQLLSSNFWSGFGMVVQGSIPRNNFTIRTGGYGSSMDFVGYYR